MGQPIMLNNVIAAAAPTQLVQPIAVQQVQQIQPLPVVQNVNNTIPEYNYNHFVDPNPNPNNNNISLLLPTTDQSFNLPIPIQPNGFTNLRINMPSIVPQNNSLSYVLQSTGSTGGPFLTNAGFLQRSSQSSISTSIYNFVSNKTRTNLNSVSSFPSNSYKVPCNSAISLQSGRSSVLKSIDV